MKRWLHEDVPVPRRTQFRRRQEALRNARLHVNAPSSESEGELVHSEEDGDYDMADPPEPPVPFPDEDETSSDNIISEGPSSPSDEESRSEHSDRSQSEQEWDEENEGEGAEAGVDVVEGGVMDLHPPLPRQQEDNPVCGPNNFRGHSLCPCTTTTEGDVFLMVLALAQRYGLPWVAAVDILTLINKAFGSKVVHNSKYYLLKDLDRSKGVTTIYMYCPLCLKDLGTKEGVFEEEMVMQCPNCNESIKPFAKNSSYFVSVNPGEQLKQLMETPGVAQEVMHYRFERRKENADAYEDIYDGALYKRLSEPDQPLAVPENVSITINTDGLSLGDTSAQSAWPIFMHINELSPQNRKKHIIYAGMWVGKKQPDMGIFLKHFVEDMRVFADVGFHWKDSDGAEKTSKVIPIIAVLDSQARYKFLNLTSFAGYMGCTLCYQRAEQVAAVGRRYTVQRQPADLRTQESMMSDMQEAHARRDHPNERQRGNYRGCKGFTPLVYLHPYFDLGAGVVVDFMHNALLGVTRSHMYAFIKTAGAPYYIGSPEMLHVMDQRLKRIRPPKSITRTPRELAQVKKFQASEWRSFLLFYSLLCFDGQLENKYLHHFALLSASFYILLKKSITVNELQQVHTYLRKYVFLTEKYFTKAAMTYNVHLLLHVTKAVSDWGPISGYSTFVFEGENHFLNKMYTSSGRVAEQLTRRYLTFKAFPKLCEKLASSDVPLNFAKAITGKTYSSFLRCNGTILVGKPVSQNLTAEEQDSIRLLNLDLGAEVHVDSYNRMLHQKIRFTTNSYSEGKNNDDSWIKIVGNRRGFIKSIYYIQNRVVILLQEVLVDLDPIIRVQLVTVTHIKRIQAQGNVIAILPHDIIGQCLHMELDNGNFIVDIPNGCYGD